jgi:hypothetical protein
LAFAVNTGNFNWSPGSFGAPAIGSNQGGVFLLYEFGVYPRMLTSKEANKLVQNIRDYSKQPFGAPE